MDYRIRMKTLILSLGSCAAFLLVYISVFTTSGSSENGLYFSSNLSRQVQRLHSSVSVSFKKKFFLPFFDQKIFSQKNKLFFLI
jgi:hypothetical protein